MANKKKFFQYLIITFCIIFTIRAFILDSNYISSGSMVPTLMSGDRILTNKFIYGLSIPFTNIKVFDFHKPKRGDIVIFEPPSREFSEQQGFNNQLETRDNFIKRIVALEGDTLKILDNTLYINGKKIERKKHKKLFNFKALRNPHWVRFSSYMYEEKLLHHSFNSINIIPLPSLVSHFGLNKYGRVSYQKESITKPYTIPKGMFFVVGDNRGDSEDSRYFGPIPIKNIKGAPMMIWYSSIDGETQFNRIFKTFYHQ